MEDTMNEILTKRLEDIGISREGILKLLVHLKQPVLSFTLLVWRI